MLYISDNALFMARHVAKVHGITSPNLKVIGVNTLHFKPFLTLHLQKKFVGFGHFISRVKMSGRSTA